MYNIRESVYAAHRGGKRGLPAAERRRDVARDLWVLLAELAVERLDALAVALGVVPLVPEARLVLALMTREEDAG